MAYNVKDLITKLAVNESYVNNNVEDSLAEARLDDLLANMNESYMRLPFSTEAVHMIHIGENYHIPYKDMVRFCEAGGYENFLEAVPIIAEHYNVSENNIVVFIESEDTGSVEKTVERIQDAIDNNMPILCRDSDYSDEVSFSLIFGEDAKIIDDEEDDVELITEEDPDLDDSITQINKEGFDYHVGMVNVYNNDFDFYLEMDDVEKYMDYMNIDSIREAVWNIANYNNIDFGKIKLLCESKSRITKKKSKKAKKSSKRRNKKKLNKIMTSSTFRKKLKIGWLDTQKSAKVK